MRHFSRLVLVTSCALGLVLGGCGGSRETKSARLAPPTLTTIGVNAYIWRAALETVGFMPLMQTDAATGVILSDWYVNPAIPGERVKVSVFVLDQDLRADAVKVSAQRQEARAGAWTDVAVRAGTVQKLEETILTRARQIRQSTVR
jgi:Domain of unknown function (DUF3576)